MSEPYKPFGGRTDLDEGTDEFTLEPNATVASFIGGTGGSNGGDSGGNQRDARGAEFDPTIHSGPDKFNSDGSFRKKRGRKGGTSSGSRGSGKAYNQAGIEGLTRALIIVHLGLASASRCPELMLENDDAKALSNATVNVLNEFDIAPSQKVQAFVGLAVTAGTIYGAKAILIRQRLKEEKAEKESASSA